MYPFIATSKTQQSGDISLGASEVNKASQAGLDASDEFLTQSGLATLNGVTLARTFIKGIIISAAATTPTVFSAGIAVMVLSEDILDVDVPSVMQHQGKPQLSWIARLLEPTSADVSTQLHPLPLTALALDSRAQRKMEGTDTKVRVMGAKDGATEFDVTIVIAVTCLWLY